jgi:DNA-binding MarR family transcriptional regulator
MDKVDRIIAQWNAERPDLDVSPMAFFGRLKRLTDHLSREMEQTFLRHGLNQPSFDMLAALRRSGPPYALSPTDLLASMMVTSGTMTNRIDRLVQAGLVERRPNPEDGRSALVALTEEGFARAEAVVADHVATQARLYALLPPEQQGQLEQIVRGYLACFENRS